MNSDKQASAMWASDRAESATSEPPIEVDTTKPHIARVYDYFLGGKDNYEVDREAAHAVLAKHPVLRTLSWVNREYLQRGVAYLTQEAGIDQFIDVGSGLPTQRNVHEVAQEINPDAKVLYVDIDPIVLAHGRVLLARNGNTRVILGDIADPSAILDSDAAQELIDFDRPWAFIGCLLLPHLTDAQDPVGVMQQIKDRMVSGSHVMLSNALLDDDPGTSDAARTMQENVGTGYARDWSTNLAFFSGLELVDPGMVHLHEWRPNDLVTVPHTLSTLFVGGIGRKP